MQSPKANRSKLNRYLFTVFLILVGAGSIIIIGPIIFSVMDGHLFVAIKEYLYAVVLLTILTISLVTFVFIIKKEKKGKILKSSQFAAKSFYIPMCNCMIVILGTLGWLGIGNVSPILCVAGYTLRSFGILAMFITPAFGLLFGNKALKEMKCSKRHIKGQSMAIAGIVLSIIMWLYLLIRIILRFKLPDYNFIF